MTKEDFFTRYTFNRETDSLGAGSFGAVYRAYDTVLDRWVALKIAPASGASESMRLRREVELVKNLPEHPNVASYEECFTFSDAAGEVDIAVLRYYPEGSLADKLASGALSDREMRQVVAQIIAGLRFLHSHGVVHRDLKPGNILMARRPDGTPVAKIADFGISKSAEADDDTMTTAVTVGYASPEQLSGAAVGPASDLWSLGVIVYRMVTGRIPFTADDADPNSMQGRARIIEKITSAHLPADIARMPQPWKRLIQACLTADPIARLASEASLAGMLDGDVSYAGAGSDAPRSAAPSLADLAPGSVIPASDGTIISPSPSATSRNPGTAPVAPAPQKRNNSWLVVVIVLALALIGVWLYLLLPRQSGSSEVMEQPLYSEPVEQAVTPVTVIEEDPLPEPAVQDTVTEINYAPADTTVSLPPPSPSHPAHEAEVDTIGSASFFD